MPLQCTSGSCKLRFFPYPPGEYLVGVLWLLTVSTGNLDHPLVARACDMFIWVDSWFTSREIPSFVFLGYRILIDLWLVIGSM